MASDVTQFPASGTWNQIFATHKFVMHLLILNTTFFFFFATSLKTVMNLLSTKHNIYICHTHLFVGLFDYI